MKTIGEVSKEFNLSISTIRYYDKEGLLKKVKRENGIRKFDEKDIETLFYIECLKKAGMQIKDIKKFLDYVAKGNSTLKQRLEMITAQRETVEKEIAEKQNVLDVLKYKTWYYTEAIKLGDDSSLRNGDLSKMPPEIRECYTKTHPNKKEK